MTGPNVLVWLGLALVPASAATALLTSAYNDHQRALALTWEHRGTDAQRRQSPGEAVLAFRTALRFARDDRGLRLNLAQSLAADGRTAEARAYLIRLWDDQPGNGRVNLELARLAARDRALSEAARYYHNAIEGAWPEAAEERRREVRVELAQHLVARGDNHLAQAELIALTGDLPAEPAFHLRIAALLSAAGAHRRALELYGPLVQVPATRREALAGAASAAFALGEHATAARHLKQLPASGMNADLRGMLELSSLVLQLNPYRPGLSAGERARRAIRMLQIAEARLAACAAAPPDLQALRTAMSSAKRTTASALVRDPERVDDVVSLALRVEGAARDSCGLLTTADRALLILATLVQEATT